MLGFFSDVEKEQLETLKKNLISPKECFFHRYKDLADFKKINERMWYWQWHYLYSAGTLFANTLKHLGKAFYSLLSLQFAVAGERFTEAGKSLGAAFVKLSLDIGLLCLHLARFLSLFIATFFPELSFVAGLIIGLILVFGFPATGMVGALVGLCACIIGTAVLFSSLVTRKSNSVVVNEQQLVELSEYEKFNDQVNEEREQIINRLEQLCSKSADSKLQASQNHNRCLFSGKKVPIEVLRAKVEASQLVNSLLVSLDQYPDFSLERADNEWNYISVLHNELNEHHTKVKMLAEEYFCRVDMVELLKEKNAPTLATF